MAENVDSLRRMSDASSSALMKEFDKGVMKVPLEFDGKIHDRCPSFPQFEVDQRQRIDRYWNDLYLKSVNTTLSYIQDWFTKISFANKLAFIRQIIPKMIDSRKLYDVAYFIGPPLKDQVYARTQFTRSSYDVTPTDHNRAVGDLTSDWNSDVSYYIGWFESLGPQEQFNAIMGLSQLGGSALQEILYGDVVAILEQKEKDLIRRRVLEYLALAKKNAGPNVISSKVFRKKKFRPRPKHPFNKNQPAKSIKKTSIRKSKDNGSVVGEDEMADYVALLQEKLDAYKNALTAMKTIAELHEGKSGKKDSVSRNKSNVSNLHSKDRWKSHANKLDMSLDRIQMLPLWDNRRIAAMLPERTLGQIVHVNKYWRDMVERTRREVKIRKRIDKFVLPSSLGAHRAVVPKDDLPLKKVGHVKKGDSPGLKDLTTKRSYDEEPLMPEDFLAQLGVTQVFSDARPKFYPFSNRCREFVICDRFCDDRVMDATHRWAAYSNKMDVEFCNVIYGVPCNLRLEDAHKQKISCLCFHADGAHVFTGGYDGLVKLYDIWKGAVKLIYPGHKGIVVDVYASCRYVASCGMDKQMRVYNISDGKCMLCLVQDHSPCRLILTKCGNPLLYLANSVGELIMYDVRSPDRIKQIGDPIYAHNGEITSLHHYPCLLISTGVDGFARMWTSNFEAPAWVISLKHPVRVNSAALSYKKVVTASEDGKIRIWDVMTSQCEKIICVVKNARPILDMVCIPTSSSVKLVLSNEAGIKVLEFPLQADRKKKVGRLHESPMKPIADLQKTMRALNPPLTAYEKRMMKLHMRQAVHPEIRPSPMEPSPTNFLLDNVSWSSDPMKETEIKSEAKRSKFNAL